MVSLYESERGFQEWVVSCATLRGWAWGHIGQAKGAKDRWITPVSGAMGKGHADLLLVRERIIYAELKSQKGGLRPDQVEWIRRMRYAGAEVYVWRPSDRPEIERVLE